MFKKKYIRWLLLILLLLAVLWVAGIFLRPEGAMEEPQGEPAPEEEQGTVQEAPEEEEWIPAEEQVITQEDIDSNYADYAKEKITFDLEKEFGKEENAGMETVNAVGMVFDIEEDKALSGASIYIEPVRLVIDGTDIECLGNSRAKVANPLVIKTGEDGRFQITNMPEGNFNFRIHAEGYEDALYYNYEIDIAGGTNIFTFFVNRNRGILHQEKIPPL